MGAQRLEPHHGVSRSVRPSRARRPAVSTRRASPSARPAARTSRTNCPRDRRLAPNLLQGVGGSQRTEAHLRRLERGPQRVAQIPRPEIHGRLELPLDRQPNDAVTPGHGLGQPLPHVLLRTARGHVERQVVHLRLGHDAPLAGRRPVGRDDRRDRAPHAVLSERQRFRVAGVGVAGGVSRAMVVSQERVGQAGPFEVGGVEGRVGLLAVALRGERRPLRGVAERHVHAIPAYAESVEEAAGAGRGAMGGTPQRQSGAEPDRLEARLAEHVHVRAPVREGVEAAGAVRVVVARREVDGEREEVGERRAHERGRVGRHPFVLVEVAPAEQGAGVQLPRQGGNPAERVPERLPPPARRGPLGPGPREPRVEMEVREVNDSHARYPGRCSGSRLAQGGSCDPHGAADGPGHCTCGPPRNGAAAPG